MTYLCYSCQQGLLPVHLMKTEGFTHIQLSPHRGHIYVCQLLLLLFLRVYTFHCEMSHCEIFAVVQSLSHVQLCNPMDCSTPGFPLFHYVSAFEQTHVHWVSDAIQPSHPLTPTSPPNYLIFSWTSLYYNINTFSAYGSFTHTSPYTTQIQ